MKPSSVELGTIIRMARKATGLTIAELATQLGRPREWLNRIELGYSEYGEHRPPTQSEIRMLHRYIADGMNVELESVLSIGLKAEEDFHSLRQSENRVSRKTMGRLTQAEVILGEESIVEAIINLIHTQEPDSVLRNTGVRDESNSMKSTEGWARYRKTLGQFLSDNPTAILKRVEYAPSKETLEIAKQSDVRLGGPRDIHDVHNAKVRFRTKNPFQLHILIGKREAILALPNIAGQPGSNMALLIRDKQFIEALGLWYDEILWEGGDASQLVKFAEFDKSFRTIADMYGVERPSEPDPV